MPTTTDYRQHLEVETPESVILDYEVAGIGSRALAAILDTLILIVWSVVLMVAFSLFAKVSSGWAEAGLILSYFASLWGYFAFFEGLRGGQTPGKRRVGIRVVSDTGHPVTLGAAATRNLLRAADFLPPPYLLGVLLVALHPRAKRLGDMVAGTVVVRDRPIDSGGRLPAASGAATAEESAPPQLDEQEFQLLLQFCERAPFLEPAVRDRLADRLLTRLGPRFPHRPAGSGEFLSQLYQQESARRQGRFAARFRGGNTATRMVARKQTRWREFEVLAERASHDGLDSFEAGELPDFAARYREVAADLARARTYQADLGAQHRLERLVAAGHNALYRDEPKTARRVWEVLLRECPAAILQARRYVLLAMLSFWVPAAGGFLLLRDRPALAQELLPDVMLERADAGAERARNGHGYVEIEAQVRPVVAAGIIGNNLTVTFNCFAGGIFLGVGSLVMLAYNGLSLGAIAAHFANRGLLGYLLTFIVGHGVLELSAIWVAGAAGFLLGRSLVAPGDLTRAEALVLNGRLAIRMVGATAILLVVAGSIEGFLSTSRQPLPYRLGVSAASAVFLALYLLNGARSRPVAGAG